ncbi:hypothetical protein [Chryseobacterium sp. JUb7]|nr:hypothetical protein [Chryseobacterium sp. JUb7]MCS3531575.1 hypothetical protein [Chryseobacterium sp. JUb7]
MSLFNWLEDGSLRLEVKIGYNLYIKTTFPLPTSNLQPMRH